ncbi:hypothetical protein Q0590_00055 [Rhodocytophaga aerolata]|uniref:Uncharacterized protein n=1 Tax=Rhodocytophaga aerolata TaxID=455078 RepID=A0ABT8QXP8_9BACT|nr:hypothetical protein [Rhodocytophaga aerolata]MDO1444616.1 hypothetical protein [Rhodocytophaga aerolata]
MLKKNDLDGSFAFYVGAHLPAAILILLTLLEDLDASKQNFTNAANV